jgi:hypothetical protein
MDAGVLSFRGTTYAIPSALSAPAPTDGTRALVFDTSTEALVWVTWGSVNLRTQMPVAYAVITTGAYTEFRFIVPTYRVGYNVFDVCRVGDDNNMGHYADLYDAVLFRGADTTNNRGPRVIEIEQAFTGQEVNTLGNGVAFPGNITVVDTGTGAITGSGTRFLRDFAVGDWIGLGGAGVTVRTWARVTAVGSDTALTVASVTAVTTPATYYRAYAHGPHAHGLKAAKGLTENLTIRGYGTNEGKAQLTYGFHKSSGTTPNTDCVPFFDFASAEYLQLNNLYIFVDWLSSAGDYANSCVFKGGKQIWLKNIIISNYSTGFGGCSCIWNISVTPYAGWGFPTHKFEDVVFNSIGGSSLTERMVFYVAVGSVTGFLTFDRCSWAGNASYFMGHADGIGSTPDIEFLWQNGDLLGTPSIALFKTRATAPVHMFRIRNTRVSVSGTPKVAVYSTADVTTDVALVVFEECLFTASLNFLGTQFASGILATGNTGTLNDLGTFDLYADGATLTGTPYALTRRETGEFKRTGPGAGALVYELASQAMASGTKSVKIGTGTTSGQTTIEIGASSNNTVKLMNSFGVMDTSGSNRVLVDADTCRARLPNSVTNNDDVPSQPLTLLNRLLTAGTYHFRAQLIYSADTSSTGIDVYLTADTALMSPCVLAYGDASDAVVSTGSGTSTEMVGPSSSGPGNYRSLEIEGTVVITADSLMRLFFAPTLDTPITVIAGSHVEWTRLSF